MKTPTNDDMLTAADWLDFNEDTAEEGEACHAVADWLREYVKSSFLRKIARQRRVPVDALRKKLAEINSQKVK